MIVFVYCVLGYKFVDDVEVLVCQFVFYEKEEGFVVFIVEVVFYDCWYCFFNGYLKGFFDCIGVVYEGFVEVKEVNCYF